MTTSQVPDIEPWRAVETGDPQRVIEYTLKTYHPRVAVACSFSMEDVLIVDWAVHARYDVRVFCLDTGRLPEATYEIADIVRRRYGVEVEWFHPEPLEVEALLRDRGPLSFRGSLDERHYCCGIRKVKPLARALADTDAWITGQRRAQSITRAEIEVFEPGVPGQPLKVNPLAAWSLEDVRAETLRKNLPYHRLYDEGYTSIGCTPCTRAVGPDEDERAGRWWWERPEHKECGLHGRPGFEANR